MHKVHTLLTITFLGLAAAAAAQTADDAVDVVSAERPEQPEIRRYSVEIILFRYGAGVPAGNEVFLPDPPPEPAALPSPHSADAPGDDAAVPAFGDLAAELPDAVPLDAPEVNSDSIELEEIVLPTNLVKLEVLPREALTLSDVHDKLTLLDAYEPVLWAGWTQAAVEPDLSPEISLRRLGNMAPQFDGMLKLYLSRFLHLVVDLTLTPRQERRFDAPVPRYGDPGSAAVQFDRGAFAEPDTGTVRLRIREDRIVKNGDLRYFDHPRFGLLAKVTRVEEPEPETADDTEFLAPAPIEP